MLDNLNARQQEGDGQFTPSLETRCPRLSSVGSAPNQAIYFESGDEVTLFQAQTNTFPVVEKHNDRYVLVKAFAELTDARLFIEGTHYLIWYRAEFP